MGFNEGSSNFVMPVGPAMYNGNNGSSWGNGSDWLIILFLFALMGNWGNNGNNNGNGGNSGCPGSMFPYFTAQNTDAAIQRGFDQSAVTGQLAGIQTSLTNGFASAEVASCNRDLNQIKATYDSEIASMTQRFNDTLSINNNLNNINESLRDCCCENRAGIADLKYTVATEACADRNASANNTRDIIDTVNNRAQDLMDKLCQLELDGVKAQVAQKDDIIAQLRSEAMYAKGEASRLANADQIVDSIYNRLNNCPVGTTPVYGRTPIFTCNNNNCGCGSF